MGEHLLLKWGTLKGWDFSENEEAQTLMEKFLEGGMSMSAAMQRNTPEQDKILCDIIDATKGEITNDWSGETLTKEQAKDYVINYRKK